MRLYSKVFDQWKQEQKVSFTWETIISTLEELDDNSTTAGIREWLDEGASNWHLIIIIVFFHFSWILQVFVITTLIIIIIITSLIH